jgi:hypothetical protein
VQIKAALDRARPFRSAGAAPTSAGRDRPLAARLSGLLNSVASSSRLIVFAPRAALSKRRVPAGALERHKVGESFDL